MTFPLRTPTSRTALTVDAWAFPLFDPVSKTYVGRPAPSPPGLGRGRVVSAIPLNGGPQCLVPDRLVTDAWGFMLADPDGTIIGQPGVRVNRLLGARWSQDTRGLG